MEKSTRWAFTAYPEQWSLFNVAPSIVAEWGWNTEECPDTGRKHYQGFIRTSRQVRFKQLKDLLPGVHLEQAKNWDALLNYCKKEDTRVDGTEPNHQTFSGRSMSMSQALIYLARHRPRIDYSRAETPAEYKQLYIQEFEMAVLNVLREDENLIGLYSQPQYQRAYILGRSVWIEKAEQTDRQTDEADAEIVETEIDDSRLDASAVHFLE